MAALETAPGWPSETRTPGFIHYETEERELGRIKQELLHVMSNPLL
jgi:hypothetical protein